MAEVPHVVGVVSVVSGEAVGVVDYCGRLFAVFVFAGVLGAGFDVVFDGLGIVAGGVGFGRWCGLLEVVFPVDL